MFPRAIVSAGSVISEIGCVWWLTQPCSHFNSTLPSTNKKLYLPLTFLWLWDPTGGPSCEEVKVRDGVHLHVVKEHFVIRTSVNLKETRTSRFLAKKRTRARATFRKKKHFERVSVCVPERSGCWLGCRWRYIWPTSGLPDWQSGRSGFSHCSELWHLLKHNVIGQRLNSEITNDSCNVKFNLAFFLLPFTPSGEVKDSDVRCVRAHHQIRLTHTEKHRVSFGLGKGQQLLHRSLKKKTHIVKCQTQDWGSIRNHAQNEREPAACESGPCSVPQCRGSRRARPQYESHREMSLESQRVWRIREGFGSATGIKVVKCPRVFHLYCAEKFLQARRQWSASHSTPPLSPRGLRKQRYMICFLILKSVSTVSHPDGLEILVKFCSDVC